MRFFAAAHDDHQLIPWSADPHVSQAKLYNQAGLQLLTVETNSPVDDHWETAGDFQILAQLDLDEQFESYAGSMYEAVATSILDCKTTEKINDVLPPTSHFGPAHSARSVFLATYLAQIEQLDPKQTSLAAMAALVHDWGHGLQSRPHSQASMQLLLALYNTDAQKKLTAQIENNLQKLIQTPAGFVCQDHWTLCDTKLLTQLVTEHSAANFRAIWQHRRAACPETFNYDFAAASVFHDAIALDRVRFGNELDARLLMTNGALQMLHLSKQEFDLYRA